MISRKRLVERLEDRGFQAKRILRHKYHKWELGYHGYMTPVNNQMFIERGVRCKLCKISKKEWDEVRYESKKI